MRVTRAAINRALANAGLEGVEIQKGSGYWYFWGGDAHTWYASSVYVFRLSSLSVEEWVGEALRLRAGR